MFNNKKEINQLRQELTDHLVNLSTDLNKKLQNHENSLTNLYELIKELKQNNINSEEKVKQELEEIDNIKSNFETALNRINSTSKNIEETAAINVREVAEKEIESIQRNSKQFRNLEKDIRSIVEKINVLQLEISKFISISQQIKLVDFSLKTYKEEISKTEKERINLINENERLKSIMAKMKRNR